jgi:uncharacterized OsmC-like protein
VRNNMSAAGLSEFAHEVREEPEQGHAGYGVTVEWLTGTRAQARTLPMTLGDQSLNRDFRWLIDEPRQLGGTNHAPNPQEYLLSAFGSCLMVAYLVGASVLGIQLSELEIDVRSELDLAGFLATDPNSPVQLKAIRYVIRVEGDGTPEQFESLRLAAQTHSPNAMSLATGVAVEGTVIVG